jgi:hypothetical protein
MGVSMAITAVAASKVEAVTAEADVEQHVSMAITAVAASKAAECFVIWSRCKAPRGAAGGHG